MPLITSGMKSGVMVSVGGMVATIVVTPVTETLGMIVVLIVVFVTTPVSRVRNPGA